MPKHPFRICLPIGFVSSSRRFFFFFSLFWPKDVCDETDRGCAVKWRSIQYLTAGGFYVKWVRMVCGAGRIVIMMKREISLRLYLACIRSIKGNVTTPNLYNINGGTRGRIEWNGRANNVMCPDPKLVRETNHIFLEQIMHSRGTILHIQHSREEYLLNV